MADLKIVQDFIAKTFPALPMQITAVGDKTAEVIYQVGDHSLRPGGTINGPTMMMVADVALYIAIQGTVGITPMAVTSSLNFNFLKRPKAGADLIGICKLLKVGRSLAVGEVTIFSEGQSEPVCHATGTYALPSKAGKVNLQG